MLIPHEDGKWSWDDGPICDTKDDALKTAKAVVSDAKPNVYTIDAVETVEVIEDEG